MTEQPRKPGRPAPLGRKLTACVRLTPDVDEYLRSTGGLAQVDAIVRGTKEFRKWMAAKGAKVMGVVANVSADTFPRQSKFIPPGTKCSVYFNYNTSRTFPGVIVRNDIEQPFVGIIRLDDGRHICMKECQYQILK